MNRGIVVSVSVLSVAILLTLSGGVASAQVAPPASPVQVAFAPTAVLGSPILGSVVGPSNTSVNLQMYLDIGSWWNNVTNTSAVPAVYATTINLTSPIANSTVTREISIPTSTLISARFAIVATATQYVNHTAVGNASRVAVVIVAVTPQLNTTYVENFLAQLENDWLAINHQINGPGGIVATLAFVTVGLLILAWLFITGWGSMFAYWTYRDYLRDRPWIAQGVRSRWREKLRETPWTSWETAPPSTVEKRVTEGANYGRYYRSGFCDYCSQVPLQEGRMINHLRYIHDIANPSIEKGDYFVDEKVKEHLDALRRERDYRPRFGRRPRFTNLRLHGEPGEKIG